MEMVVKYMGRDFTKEDEEYVSGVKDYVLDFIKNNPNKLAGHNANLTTVSETFVRIMITPSS